MSFMSSLKDRDSHKHTTPAAEEPFSNPKTFKNTTETPSEPRNQSPSQYDGSATQHRQRERAGSIRPASMIQTYHPSMMNVTQDTLPELQPIFTFLNSHANKLYQEGYFLKLDDQNTRPSLPGPELFV